MIETLSSATLASTPLFLAFWTLFRLAPRLSPVAKAWLWRLAFLKPLAGLLPFAFVTLRVLPPTRMELPIVPLVPMTEPVAHAVLPASSVAETSSSANPLLVAWSIGVFLVASYAVRQWARAQSVARRAQPVENVGLRSLLFELAQRAKVRRPIRLLHSPEVKTAMLVGGSRLAIVLPSRALEGGEKADLRFMLAHEVAHIARRDLPWFAVTWVVQTLFFFNPAVWLAAYASRLDHESATDRLACRLAGAPVKTYAAMLVRATVVARPALVPGALPMAESYRTIHRRLEAMKHFDTKPTRWRQAALAMLALTTIGLLPTYRFAEAAPAPTPQEKAKASKSDPKSSQKSAKDAKQTKSTSPSGSKSSKPKDNGTEKATPVNRQSSSQSTSSGSNSGASPSISGSAEDMQKQMQKMVDDFMKSAQENQAGFGSPGLTGASASASASSSQTSSSRSSSSSGSGSSSDRGAWSDSRKENSSQNDSTQRSSSSSSTDEPAGKGSNGSSSTTRSSGSMSSSSGPDGTKISFKFENYDGAQALQSLLRQSGKGFQIEPGMTRRITTQGKDLSFEEALQSLLKATDSSLRQEGGTLIVTPRAKRSGV